MRIFLLILGAVFITVQLSACTTNEGDFYLVNKSSENIVQALVTICGQQIKMKNIKPDEKKLGSYKVKSDSHYVIKIEFQSGKVLQKEVGYVTNGLNYKHIITVTDSNIKIENDHIP